MPEVDLTICNYLKKICSKMEAGCWLSMERLEPVIFLATQPDVWQQLDPLRRAKAVLVAKDWVQVSWHLSLTRPSMLSASLSRAWKRKRPPEAFSVDPLPGRCADA